ncbi:MAG: T9SS type A sorting domain-containing protein, partial [Bacteroidota bacterium]|nr:T9SS type A sorting domain-containing protein [Bacteroidota bacterium]
AKQVDYTGRPRPTKSTMFQDDSRSPVSLINPKIKKSLDFSENTLYEIFDTYGNLVKKGYGQSISVENLEKGLYYVNYDSKTGEVVSKK